MALHPAFVLCLVCCGALSVALAAPPSNNNGAADEEPDLLQMLDFFKGKSDMTLFVSFLKEVSMARTTVTELMHVCIPCKNVFANAAETNVGMRILNKVVNGQTPDIRDMYDLATEGAGNMLTAFFAARKKTKKYDQIVTILNAKNSLLLTPSTLEEGLYDLTGTRFQINPELMKEVNSGTAEFTVSNAAELNLLYLVSAWQSNYPVLSTFLDALFKPPVNVGRLVGILNQLDGHDILRIKSINRSMDNGKYVVTGGKQTFVTNPLAIKLVNVEFPELQQQKSADSAETLVMSAVMDFMKLTADVLKAAEVNRKI